jgi:hypothetical protein
VAKKTGRTNWRVRALDAEGKLKGLAETLELQLAKADDKVASERAELHFWRQQLYDLQQEMVGLLRWQAKEDATAKRGASRG